jgi:outer membrane protein
MRNLMKFVAVLLLVVASVTINAQTLKFGHIELQALIQVMPESTKAQAELEKFNKDLEDVLVELNTGYQQKLAEFEQLGADVTEVRRNAKITEIQEISTRIENFRNGAYQQIQQKQAELLQPIYDKAEAAIEEVARAQGLIYVFDVQAVLYKSNQSVDILPLVKEKLGIK